MSILAELMLKSNASTSYATEFDLTNWLISHSKAKRIVMVAGKLGFEPKEQQKIAETVKWLIIDGRVKFEIICGPEILIDNNTRRNELFFLLDEKDDKLMNNFLVYIAPSRAPVHYIVADIDVIIESSHSLINLKGRKFFSVINSSFWKSRLLNDFNKLKKKSKIVLGARNYPNLYTLDQLIEKIVPSN